jgi:predicted nuclease with RNAse H fold
MRRADRKCWAGVDVGGARKGFHIAVIDRAGVLAVEHEHDASAVATLLRSLGPAVIGVDSPSSSAPPGRKSREGERQLAAAGICGIRYTPCWDMLRSPHPTRYYEWILRGFDLYEALATAPGARWEVIEVFPTASWSQWSGRRQQGITRAAWSTKALDERHLEGVPRVASQDIRDALAAAVTARLYPDRTIGFCEIVVPRAEGPTSPVD